MNYVMIQKWAMYMFARQNPVLAPRRKAKTALRWLVAAKMAAETNPERDENVKWAATALLDVSHNLVYPPDWPKCCPPDWKPGGVEDDVVKHLAKFTLYERLRWFSQPLWAEEGAEGYLQREAWTLTYPMTWQAVAYPRLDQTNREDFLKKAEETIWQEWELIWTPDYCHEWYGFVAPYQLEQFLAVADIPRQDLAVRGEALRYERWGGTMLIYTDYQETPALTVVFQPGQQPGAVPPELQEAVSYRTDIR